MGGGVRGELKPYFTACGLCQENQQRELIVFDRQGTQQQGPETATETVSGEFDTGILTELGRPTNYDSNSSMYKNSC